MTDVLQWLPVSSRVQYEILLLVARPQGGLAQNIFATQCASICSLYLPTLSGSANGLHLPVPRTAYGSAPTVPLPSRTLLYMRNDLHNSP